jgi:hypothetical protein
MCYMLLSPAGLNSRAAPRTAVKAAAGPRGNEMTSLPAFHSSMSSMFEPNTMVAKDVFTQNIYKNVGFVPKKMQQTPRFWKYFG